MGSVIIEKSKVLSFLNGDNSTNGAKSSRLHILHCYSTLLYMSQVFVLLEECLLLSMYSQGN